MSRVNCYKSTVAQVIVVIAAVLKVFRSELTVGQVVQYRTFIAPSPQPAVCGDSVAVEPFCS